MSEYVISIILPIYNVENYLRNALDSIINQTFDINKLEVIMVDDCSSDNSGNIIDSYAHKFDNFTAIHLDKNSGGAGKPRNIGLEYVTSDYILFLDPDDEFMPDICEVLLNELLTKNADIVTGNAICLSGDKELIDIYYPEKYYDIIPNKNLDLFKSFRIWGTLFKKSLIFDNKIKFIDVATNEDTYFVYNCFFKANKIIYLNDYIGVKHYERDSMEFVSLSHDFSKSRIIGTIEAFKEISILIKDSKPNKDYVYDPCISNIFARFSYKWNMSKSDKVEIFEKILEYEKNSNYIINLPIQFKFMDFLLNHKWYNCLIVTQSIYSKFIQLSFIQSYINKKKFNY